MRLGSNGSSRWRVVAVLAIGVAIGTTMMATPAASHVTSSVLHVRDHMKQYFFTKAQSEARYANAVAGTDKAKNAELLDGVDSTGFYAAGSKVADAEMLDGNDSTGFYAAGSKVADAEMLDGNDSSAFVKQTDERVFAYGQIREDGSIRARSSRVVSVGHPSTGIYCVTFSSAPSQTRVESAVVGSAGTSNTLMIPRVTNGQGSDCGAVPGSHLFIRIHSTTGTLMDGRFSFIVP